MNLRLTVPAVTVTCVVAWFLAVPQPAFGVATVPTGFVEEELVGGLTAPVSFDLLPDGRVLIAEQVTANVRLWVPGAATTSVILTVPDVGFTHGEQGLLSVVVDDQWPARPFIYVFVDHRAGAEIDERVLRYELTGDTSDGTSSNLMVDIGSKVAILTGIRDARGNHNGGSLRFGPGGMLYLSTGDDEDKCAAQNVDRLEGKILRMKVSGLATRIVDPVPRADITPSDNPFVGGTDVAGLVWALGLRNPFRMHVDQDGSVLVADVGWTVIEEVSRGASPGVNFGWPYYEGTFHRDSTTIEATILANCPEPPGFTYQPPMHEYNRGGFTASVIGAGIYRAPQGASDPWPGEYGGNYFYTDFYQGWLIRLTGGPDAWSVATPVAGQPTPQRWAEGLSNPTDFQMGPDGSIWYLSRGLGSLRRIRHPAVAVETSTVGKLKARFHKAQAPRGSASPEEPR